MTTNSQGHVRDLSAAAADVVAEDLAYICRSLRDELRLLAGRRLLITGGAGFLGYYLTKAIVHHNSGTSERPVELTIFDNFRRGLPAWLQHLHGSGSVTVVDHDVATQIPERAGDFAYIIHAASIASPSHFRTYPIETMDANVNGLRRLLDYALDQQRKGTPIEGMLFCSSSEIYGDPPASETPTPETYRGNVSCTGPRACYDESKRFGETLCVSFVKEHDIPVRIVRPFSIYGPGLSMTDGRVIADFARDVLQGRDIVLFSDGSPKRTFCYVADAIVGFYKVLCRGRNGEAYNIGIEHPEISIRSLAEAVASSARELLGYKGNIVRGQSHDEAYLVDDPGRRCPDLRKARAELRYDPTIGLAEGLRRTVSWYAGTPQL